MPKLYMTPGADIHLISGGAPQTMSILADLIGGARDIAAEAITQYRDFSPAVVARNGATFTPVGVGDTVGTVSLTQTVDGRDIVHHGLLRIRVHAALRDLRIANDRISVRAGSSDYVATVYASFDDLAIADVSAHGWLRFRAGPLGHFAVDRIGRISANPGAAGGEDLLHVEGGGSSHFIPVRVINSMNAPRAILNQIRYRAPHNFVRNLLFLAEGYPDKDTFEMHVRRIVDILFTSAAHSPYNLLRDRFNVWSAFEPLASGVTQAGITFGPPVNAKGEPIPLTGTAFEGAYTIEQLTLIVGLPPGPGAPTNAAAARTTWQAAAPGFDPAKLSDPLFEMWKTQVLHGLTRPKDTTFGLMFGSHPGGPAAPEPLPPIPPLPATAKWHLMPGEPHRTLSPDPRRVPEPPAFPGTLYPTPALAFADILEGYLGSLRYGEDATHIDHNVSRAWMKDGPDAGLVAILVFDEFLGATAFTNDRVRIGLASSVGHKQAIRLTGTVTPAFPLLDHEATLAKPVYETITGMLAHELAHALGVTDEYEDTDLVGHTLAPDSEARDIESAVNVTHHSTIFNNAGVIIRANLKWNWDRVALASSLATAAVSAGGTVTFQLDTAEGDKWNAVRAKRGQVWLRPRDLNRFAPASKFAPPVGPYTIQSVTGDALVLAGPAVAVNQFPKGSVLYAPVMKDAVARKLIDPHVLDDLVLNGAFGRRSEERRVGQ